MALHACNKFIFLITPWGCHYPFLLQLNKLVYREVPEPAESQREEGGVNPGSLAAEWLLQCQIHLLTGVCAFKPKVASLGMSLRT